MMYCGARAPAQGVMNMLEAIRATDLTKSVRFYQASTSELYGKVQLPYRQHEMTLWGWRTASWLV